MNGFKHFDDIYGFKVRGKGMGSGRDVVVCPLCDSPEVRLDGIEEDGLSRSIVFSCVHGHSFRLRLDATGWRVIGVWEVGTRSELDLDELPTRKQFELAVKISQRLGISNPWSLAGCLFPDLNGPDGLPAFMTQHVSKDSAGDWISGHINEYRDRGKKTAEADTLVVWRLPDQGGSRFIMFDTVDGHAADGAEVWVGPGVRRVGTGALKGWEGETVREWARPYPGYLLEESRERGILMDGCYAEKCILAGHWERYPFAEKEPRKQHWLHSYYQAKRIAQACALNELAEGRAVSNWIPQYKGDNSFAVMVDSMY